MKNIDSILTINQYAETVCWIYYIMASVGCGVSMTDVWQRVEGGNNVVKGCVS